MSSPRAIHRPVASRCSLVLLLCVCVALSACKSSPLEISPGDFTMLEATGGTFHLRIRPNPPLLLAFLQIVPDTMGTPSRAEVTFVKSMAHQYGPRGLRVAIVDATALATAQRPTHSQLVNASYDWHLQLPLLEDNANHGARFFTVTQVPTLILLNTEGAVAQRWQGFTSAAALAQGIEKLIGGPLNGVPDFPKSDK